ncbi:MAG TPA: hypothetical protein VEC39_09785 [Vicinamibacterales bacterium]|nr:hypothetical protein [Vicinamibacterales bacterium]
MQTDNAECLLCHTVHNGSGTGRTRAWRCGRCGQHWDLVRTAAVTNYERWLKAEAATTA